MATKEIIVGKEEEFQLVSKRKVTFRKSSVVEAGQTSSRVEFAAMSVFAMLDLYKREILERVLSSLFNMID